VTTVADPPQRAALADPAAATAIVAMDRKQHQRRHILSIIVNSEADLAAPRFPDRGCGHHLRRIAHVEPLPACWAFHVVVGLCPSDAVDVLTRFRPLQRL